jgi:hypothetical protein
VRRDINKKERGLFEKWKNFKVSNFCNKWCWFGSQLSCIIIIARDKTSFHLIFQKSDQGQLSSWPWSDFAVPKAPWLCWGKTAPDEEGRRNGTCARRKGGRNDMHSIIYIDTSFPENVVAFDSRLGV